MITLPTARCGQAFRAALLILAVVLCGGCAGQHDTLPGSPSIDPESMPEYRLGPGDTVRVTVFGEDDLSGVFTLDKKSAISLPLAGEVAIGGLTSGQASRAIEDAFAQGYLREPDISLDIEEYRPFFILGEIRKPGGYPYIPGMKVLNAVALGGGFTYRANQKSITLVRPDKTGELVLNVPADHPILPGDTIRIEEKFF